MASDIKVLGKMKAKMEKVIKRKLRKKILQAFSCEFISRLIKPRSLKFGKAKTPVIT